MSCTIASTGANATPSARNLLGIAVVGCGNWGINYVRIFNELPESRVVAVCDQRCDRLLEVGWRFPGAYLTTEIEEAVSRDGVDAVIVCTEATTHHRIARPCLLARKHVLVEKPLTASVAEAEELISLAESGSTTLMVGHTFLFNAGIQKVKEYVQNGPGRVYYLHARRTNLGPIRHDVNALWDLAPHDIAIFNYLLDSVPEWVSAVGGKVLRNCREDVGFVALGYPDNVLAHIHVSWADPDKAREVVIVKSDKRIVFNDLNGLEQVRIFEKGVSVLGQEPLNYGEFRFQIRDGDIISPRIEASEPLKNQCRHFLRCIRLGQRPISGGVEGRDVVRVLEAVNHSIERKGLQVEVDRNSDYAHAAKAMASAAR
ncbi:MAG TPA: Gfo/Idh/MocA family oxidoreductase [Candidatus Acidoferrales bacterium]|nr:Gfo/Idh/MocA family oxidoreductase [Candidatus Acidoferrales bacterium]